MNAILHHSPGPPWFRGTASRRILGLLVAILAISTACTRHNIQVEPIEVKPIHMTVDINIKVDRTLDQFFDFEEEVPVPPAATTAPATTTEGARP